MRGAWWVIALGLLALNLKMETVQAQETRETAVWHGVWNDLELTVTVIAVNHPIPEAVKQTEPWWRWGNTTTDAYLFSFNNDDEVDLILAFTSEGEKPKARLYVLSQESRRKSVQIRDGQIILPPDTHPYVVIWPRQGDWLINEKANFDLEVEEIDLNGAPLWHTSVGAERPGLPKWITRTLLQDPNLTQGYPRFGAAVREDSDVTYELAPPLMPSWPYLSVVRNVSHWGEDRPVFFDPDQHQLVMPWVGFQTAGVYSINSLCYPPKTCFESPFVWYRFDPDAGRYANMVIRGDNWPKGVPFGPASPEFQRTTLRMTWTAKDYSLWRYSLTVTGNNPMEDQVYIGDTLIYSIPYRELPAWIAAQEWKAVTFVEATQGEHGSEGIYDYSVEDNPPVSAWVNGLLAESPTSFRTPLLIERPASSEAQSKAPQVSFLAPYFRYPHIHPNRLYEGFRGEYSMAFNRAPQLYLSPVDNRVHLLHAEGGVWNLGNGLALRMRNLDGGAYINGWTRERLPLEQAKITDDIMIAVPGEVEEALYVLEGYLLYSGPAGVELRQVTDQPPNLEVPIPFDRDNWQRFLDRIEPNRTQQRDPKDLQSWLSHFSGKVLRIAGGQARDVRVTADGFRFVLDLRPDAEIQGADLLGIRELMRGKHVVTYHRGDDRFVVETLTPPRLSLSPFPQGLLVEPGVEVQANTIGLRISNLGLEDANEVRVSVTASYQAEKPMSIGEQSVTVLAGEANRFTFPWTPPHAGEWTIRVTVSLSGTPPKPNGALAEYEEKVQVTAVESPSLLEAMSAFGLVPVVALTGLVVALLTTTALALNYLLHSRPVAAYPDQKREG